MKQVGLTSKVRHYEGLSKLIVQFSGLCLEKRRDREGKRRREKTLNSQLSTLNSKDMGV